MDSSEIYVLHYCLGHISPWQTLNSLFWKSTGSLNIRGLVIISISFSLSFVVRITVASTLFFFSYLLKLQRALSVTSVESRRLSWEL